MKVLVGIKRVIDYSAQKVVTVTYRSKSKIMSSISQTHECISTLSVK